MGAPSLTRRTCRRCGHARHAWQEQAGTQPSTQHVMCGYCGRASVPEVIITTVVAPPELQVRHGHARWNHAPHVELTIKRAAAVPLRGVGGWWACSELPKTLGRQVDIEAHVCRPRKRREGESSALQVSEILPFVGSLRPMQHAPPGAPVGSTRFGQRRARGVGAAPPPRFQSTTCTVSCCSSSR